MLVIPSGCCTISNPGYPGLEATNGKRSRFNCLEEMVKKWHLTSMVTCIYNELKSKSDLLDLRLHQVSPLDGARREVIAHELHSPGNSIQDVISTNN